MELLHLDNDKHEPENESRGLSLPSPVGPTKRAKPHEGYGLSLLS